MRGVAMLADTIAKNRCSLAKDHPLINRERKAAEDVTQVLRTVRKARDTVYEQTFNALFDSWGAWGPKHQ
jgi:thioredoxin-like negative regulator of GroEL